MDDSAAIDEGEDVVRQALAVDEKETEAKLTMLRALTRQHSAEQSAQYKRMLEMDAARAGVPASSFPAVATLPAAAVAAGLREVDVASVSAFQRVDISGHAELTEEERGACTQLRRAMELRRKYLYAKPAEYWGDLRKVDFPEIAEPSPRAAPGASALAARPPRATPPPASMPSLASTLVPAQAAAPQAAAPSSAAPASPEASQGLPPLSVPEVCAGTPAPVTLPPALSPLSPRPTVAVRLPPRDSSTVSLGSSGVPRVVLVDSGDASPARGGGSVSRGQPATTWSTPSRRSGGDGGVGGGAGAFASPSAAALSSHSTPGGKDGKGGDDDERGEKADEVCAPVLVTSTTTGLSLLPLPAGSAAPELALPAAAAAALRGSALVTLETGYTNYGNLFHRRRLEPRFVPFVGAASGSAASGAADSGAVSARSTSGGAASAGASSNAGGTSSAGASSGGGGATAASGTALDLRAEWRNGVVAVVSASAPDTEPPLFSAPSFDDWRADYAELLRIVHAPAVRSFAFHRLELLAARFRLHKQLNGGREQVETRSVPHRDFYNVRKCDTHVHHSACMNQKHLLSFIKAKLKRCPDEVVIARDGVHLTLREVFESLHLTAYDLSVDTLDVHAHDTFQRFDRFNAKYNPLGQSRLREIFLKTENLLRGRYLAELTREVFDDLEAAKYSLAEYRLSVYGREPGEWARLAAWVVDHRLASPQVRWMVQVPRLYEVYRAAGGIANFQDMLSNIFDPLFAVTLDPASDPKLHAFLALVVGFDSVDDESKPDAQLAGDLPLPAAWTASAQPPYSYQSFFLAANLRVLNELRAARGMTTFSYRPHAGEAGDTDHLAASFLTAESVNHGINLRRSTPLQYLYYLAQVPLAVSPLSNNRLFLDYGKSPFYELFAKGLAATLSTDDPLMLSLTREPLVEEYAVASQVWRLTTTDMCEIARTSVLMSGFEAPYKRHWLGKDYWREGPAGNDINLTNVPNIRLQFRHENLCAERALVGVEAPLFTAPPDAGSGAAATPGQHASDAMPRVATVVQFALQPK